MNDSPIEPTEEQLTAYALDELDAQERAAVEAALEREPALQAKLEEIRSAVGAVEAAYAKEAAATVLSDAQREEVIAKAQDVKPGLWTLRPVFVARFAAAATFIVVVAGLTATILPSTRTRMASSPDSIGDTSNPIRLYRAGELADLVEPESLVGMSEESIERAIETPRSGELRYEQSQTELLGEDDSDPDGNRALAEVQAEQLERMVASGYTAGGSAAVTVPDAQRKPKSDAKRPAERPAVSERAPQQPGIDPRSLSDEEKERLKAVGYGEIAVAPEQEVRARALGYTNTPAPDEQVARRIQESLGTGGGRGGSLQNVEVGGSIRIRGNAYLKDEARIQPEGTELESRAAVGVSQPTTDNVDAFLQDSVASAPVPSPGDRPRFEALTRSPEKNVQQNTQVFFNRDGVRQAPVPDDRFRVAGTPENRRLWRDPNWAWTTNRPNSPLPAITPGTEAYQYFVENTFKAVAQAPLSTFSIDVDTASYANMRRFLNNNQVPPKDSVRIEELINYFDYAYEAPSDDSEHPFAAHLEVASAPWNPQHKLVQVGIKGKEVERGEQPPSNLVFLLDVSGSMKQPNKLPLVKQAIGLLARQLRSVDRVAIVVYAGSSGMVLNSTPGDNKNAILGAVERLSAGGSTNGGAGIQLAYNVAKQNLIPGGVNRVILATDGDFNVGVTNQGDLVRLVEERAKGGVFLTALGFGMGNLKDDTLEMLSNKGNGNYAYVDTFAEARKVFVDELNGTLVTIAKDVKIQVEFNPAQVARYRLIGYENRALAAQDFNDDTKDAGEIGAGHTVTALYEIVPVGVEGPLPNVDKLKYQSKAKSTPNRAEEVSKLIESHVNTELLTLKLRYKQPEGTTSTLMEYPLSDRGEAFAQADGELQFATAVAAFGMKLRGSQHAGNTSWQDVLAWAENGLGRDAHGYRKEFLGLVRTAQRFVPDVRNLQPSIDPNTLSNIQLLNFQDTGGRVMARIQVGRSRKWYKEGDKFLDYQLIRVDPNTGCVEVLITSTGQFQTLCVADERREILNSIGYSRP